MPEEMTMLDEFAKAAMQGLAAHGFFLPYEPEPGRYAVADADQLVSLSYDIGEKMMAERERRLMAGAGTDRVP